MVNKFKIPTFFISTTKLLQTNYEKNIFLGYGNENDHFCFIVVPALKPENIPNYKLILSDKNEIFVPMKDLKESCKKTIDNAFSRQTNIQNYLKEFVKISKPKKIKVAALNIKLPIDEDEDKDNE